MKRKLIAIVLSCVMLSMVGCGSTSSTLSASTTSSMESSSTIASTEEKTLTEDEIKKITDYYNLSPSYDDFRELTFYYSTNTSRVISDNEVNSKVDNGMYLYMPHKDDSTSLRVVLKYHGYDWIFFNEVQIKTGGKIYDFPIVEDDIKRDVGGSKVLETYDTGVTDDILDILNKIKENNDCTIRFSGEKTNTVEMTAEELQGIIDVLSAYEDIQNGIVPTTTTTTTTATINSSTITTITTQ